MAVANNPDVANKTFGTSTGMIYLDDPAGLDDGLWQDADNCLQQLQQLQRVLIRYSCFIS